MKQRTVIINICLFGFFLRLIYVFYSGKALQYPDEERFWSEAMSLLERGLFQSNWKRANDMPLTGMVIATVMRLTGCGVMGVKVFFAVVSSITIYFISRLAYSILPNKKAAVLAAAIAAIYPFFIYYSSLVLSETLFLLLVTLVFLSTLASDEKNGWKTGLLLGVTHLTRPTFIYFLPFIWGWMLFVKKVPLRSVILSMLCFCILVVPWGVRNYKVLGRFNLSTSSSGQVLWEGNNPWNTTGGVSGSFPNPKTYLKSVPREKGEFEQDDWKKEQAVTFIKDNPGQFVVLSWKRFIRFWHLWPNNESLSSWKYKVVSLGSFGVVLLLFLLSPVLLWRQRNKLALIYLFTAYYTAIHMITIGSIRYRLPLEPLLIAIAGGTLTMIFCKTTKD